jgi:hypothetical protein
VRYRHCHKAKLSHPVLQGFDCSHPDLYFDVPLWFRQAFNDVGFSGPLFIAEFQGGAYDSWGSVGYEMCAKMVGYVHSSPYAIPHAHPVDASD